MIRIACRPVYITELSQQQCGNDWTYFVLQAYVSCKHGGDRVVAFDRAGVLFVFNFNGTQSFTDYRIGVDAPGKYKLVLDSDEEWFGGHSRLDHSVEYLTQNEDWGGRRASIMVCQLLPFHS